MKSISYSFDDLVVGCPLYTKTDVNTNMFAGGAIYVYSSKSPVSLVQIYADNVEQLREALKIWFWIYNQFLYKACKIFRTMLKYFLHNLHRIEQSKSIFEDHANICHIFNFIRFTFNKSGSLHYFCFNIFLKYLHKLQPPKLSW